MEGEESSNNNRWLLLHLPISRDNNYKSNLYQKSRSKRKILKLARILINTFFQEREEPLCRKVEEFTNFTDFIQMLGIGIPVENL